MPKDDSILEPLHDYNSKYKALFRENATKFFDSLTKESKVNVDENRATVKKYREACSKLENIKKLINKYRGLKGFLITITVISLVISIILIYNAINLFGLTNISELQPWIYIIISVVLIAGSITSIVVIVKIINKIIKNNDAIRIKMEKLCQELLDTCYVQMAPLNNLFDFNMTAKLITETCPLIQLDQYFDVRKYDYMNKKFGFEENNDPNSSTYYLLSGSIVGNPFILQRTFNTYMGSKTYTGSLTITYTEYDSEGRSYTRSQTLTASVVKPYPEYFYDTRLIYGNEAAPNLCFSRKPNSSVARMNEKQLEKYIKKGDKKIKKMESKALTDDDPTTNFQSMGNNKFDVLFNALDRNNEVEFRLLFTPLAQKNIVNLITTALPYGDDFEFYKNHMINIIRTGHDQGQDYYSEPSNYINYEYDKSKSSFIEYNCKYFESLYFDLAPLISIPLYQQHKPHEFIYKEVYERNFTNYETEQLANSFAIDKFKHPDSITNVILKTSLIEKNNNSDKVNVRGYTYTGIERVDYVSVYGRDGYYHDVPVYWTEYIPIFQDTVMEVSHHEESGVVFKNKLRTNERLQKFFDIYSTQNDIIYQRGLLAFILKYQSFDGDSDTLLDDILKL